MHKTKQNIRKNAWKTQSYMIAKFTLSKKQYREIKI